MTVFAELPVPLRNVYVRSTGPPGSACSCTSYCSVSIKSDVWSSSTASRQREVDSLPKDHSYLTRHTDALGVMHARTGETLSPMLKSPADSLKRTTFDSSGHT